MMKVKRLWCWVLITADGTEKIAALMSNGFPLRLIATTELEAQTMYPLVQAVIGASGWTAELREFTAATTCEVTIGQHLLAGVVCVETEGGELVPGMKGDARWN